MSSHQFMTPFRILAEYGAAVAYVPWLEVASVACLKWFSGLGLKA